MSSAKQGMSVDQNLLYRSCKAIINGFCPPSLARRKIAKVSHARWLTTAIRINFLYMSMTSPSPEIVRLATFVVTVYATLWFRAKLHWRAHEAPRIAFDTMKLIHGLPFDEQCVLKPVFERGLFWAHPEQLLLGCLGSADRDVRARAVARIIKAREGSTTQGGSKGKGGRGGKGGKRKDNPVRIFNLPKPIYTAKDFSTMIDWEKEEVTSPPYLRRYSNTDIMKFEEEPLQINIPSNSQHVERFIQLISKNARRKSSTKHGDGLCRATIQSRQ